MAEHRTPPVHPRLRPRDATPQPSAAEVIRALRVGDIIHLRVDLGDFYSELVRGRVRRKHEQMATVIREFVITIEKVQPFGSQTSCIGKGTYGGAPIPGVCIVAASLDKGAALAAIGRDPADHTEPIGFGGMLDDTWWLGGSGPVTSAKLETRS